MKIAIALGALSLFATTGAAAQMGANCRATATGMQCEETAGSRAERANAASLDAMNRAQESSRASLDRFMSDMPTSADREASRKAALQKKVATAIKAGKCDDAKKLALDAGDLDTAEKAAWLCTPAVAP